MIMRWKMLPLMIMIGKNGINKNHFHSLINFNILSEDFD